MWIAVALLILDLRWYKPEQHLADLTKWARRLGRSVPKVYHVLDAFGASQQVSSVWKTRGLAGIAYDIKLAGGHDICGETGVKEFLRMGMQLPDCTTPLMALTHPCTVFVPSVHSRCVSVSCLERCVWHLPLLSI